MSSAITCHTGLSANIGEALLLTPGQIRHLPFSGGLFTFAASEDYGLQMGGHSGVLAGRNVPDGYGLSVGESI